MGWIIVIGVLVVIVFAYSLCKVSGDSNKVAERDYEEIKKSQNDKCTILSDLEQGAVNRMKKELLQLFEVNNNKDVTIMDCIIKNDYENKQTIINNGRVVGYTL